MKETRQTNTKIIIGLIIAILVTVFAVLNSKVVEISFGFTSVNISQAIVILVSVTIGALLMYIIGIINDYKKNRVDKESHIKDGAENVITNDENSSKLFYNSDSSGGENSEK